MQQQHTGVFSGPQKPLPRECSNTLNCAKDCFMGSWSWGNLPGYGSTTDWLKSNPPPNKTSERGAENESCAAVTGKLLYAKASPACEEAMTPDSLQTFVQPEVYSFTPQ